MSATEESPAVSAPRSRFFGLSKFVLPADVDTATLVANQNWQR
ncbi:hypothetical protein KIPB_016168, partial [Kipferlia bialata]|eukprot:g16168.t1